MAVALDSKKATPLHPPLAVFALPFVYFVFLVALSFEACLRQRFTTR